MIGARACYGMLAAAEFTVMFAGIACDIKDWVERKWSGVPLLLEIQSIHTRLRWCGCMIAFVLSCTGFGSRGSVSGEESKKVVEVNARITQVAGLPAEAFADFGPIGLAERRNIRINLFNATPREIVFKSIKTGCSCMDLKVNAVRIPAGQEISIEGTYSLGAKAFNHQWTDTVQFLDKNQRLVMKLSYGWSIDSYVGFRHTHVICEVKTFDKPIAIEVPLIASSAEAAEKQVWRLEHKSNSIEFDSEIRNEGQLMVIAIPKLGIADSETAVLALICERVDGAIELPVYIRKKAEVTVSPKTLRFRIADGVWKAVVFTRFNSPTDVLDSVNANDRSFSKTTPEVRVVAFGQPHIARVAEAGPSVYRAEVSIDKRTMEMWQEKAQEGAGRFVDGEFRCSRQASTHVVGVKIVVPRGD